MDVKELEEQRKAELEGDKSSKKKQSGHGRKKQTVEQRTCFERAEEKSEVKLQLKHNFFDGYINKGERDRDYNIEDFNSLIPDEHVDVDAPKSMKEFNYIRDKLQKAKM